MNFKLRSLVAATLAGSMLMGFGANAMADSTDDILNALIAKGILTEEEGALLQKGRTGEKEAAEAKKKTAVSAKMKDGAVVFETGDGKNSMAVTGRVHMDFRNVNAKGEPGYLAAGTAMSSDTDTSGLADSMQIRRARIGVKGKLYEHFDYELLTNLVGSDTNTIDVAYINAGMFKPFQLRVGQFKQPFNLEEQTSSNNIDFMERSYVNQLAPSKKPGAMIHGIPTAGVTYAASVYQHNAFGETDSDSDGKGFAGRATANFAELAGWGDSVFHVGLAGFDSEYGVVPTNSNNTTKVPEQHTRGTIFSMRTEGRGLGNIYRAQIAGDMLPATGATDSTTAASYGLRSNTGASVDNKAFGTELAYAYGPFKLQGEYMKSKFDAIHANTGNQVSADVAAYYAEAVWMLTGEKYSDSYKNGAWSTIKPITPFDMETGKGKGALEVGVRFDQFDVDNTFASKGTAAANKNRFQGSTTGTSAGSNETTTNGSKGGAKTYTAGIKWILNPNTRVLLNYSYTKFDTPFNPVDVNTTTTVGALGSNGTSTTAGDISNEKLLMLRTQFAF